MSQKTRKATTPPGFFFYMPNLTPKQLRFCEEYLVDLNATQAALRTGYSKNTANEQGSRLLANVKIQAYISDLKAQRSKRTEISADRILRELAIVGLSDIRHYFENGWEVRDIDDIPDVQSKAIQKVKKKTRTTIKGRGDDQTTETITEVEIGLYDKLSALEKIGRHTSFFEPQQGGDEIPTPTKQIEPSPDGGTSNNGS